MSEPDLVQGKKFRLYRESSTTPGTYVFVCLASTISFKRSKEMEDTTVPDCDDPEATPFRKSVVKSRSWDLNFSGTADAERIKPVEADFESDETHSYQILIAGSRTYTGQIHIGDIDISKSENGLVKFTCTARGDGAYEKADVA